ncbi:MAG TPA: dihydrolipoamide acetyltransferase [Opitutae bacterium]|nr:dihydrolipoamide acetyltransferase [Opitutae bacterium]
MEVENFADGVMLKHYVAEGGQVPIGAPMCAIGEAGEKAPEVSTTQASSTPKAEEKPAETPKAVAASAPQQQATSEPTPAPSLATTPQSSSSNGHIKASPLAKRMAEDKGIALSALQGSGPGGRIVKADVLNAIEHGTAKLAPTMVSPVGGPVAEEKNTPVSNMRATIARRLVESKTQVPHFYIEIEVDAGPLLEFRAKLNKRYADLPPENGGGKLTINDLILKASARALYEVPQVNAAWEGDSIHQFSAVHLAFGVAIPDGLVTPVIRDAHLKSLHDISFEAKYLIAKARNKKLKPEEMTGSTFTVTNLGMFGINSFYGVINPPNAGILSVGGCFKKPIVNDVDQITIGQCMHIGFSGDHRIVDGATGAQFLGVLKEIIESPALLFV